MKNKPFEHYLQEALRELEKENEKKADELLTKYCGELLKDTGVRVVVDNTLLPGVPLWCPSACSGMEKRWIASSEPKTSPTRHFQRRLKSGETEKVGKLSFVGEFVPSQVPFRHGLTSKEKVLGH